jgi:predicted MFS family arabinose efflux permease
MATDAQAPSQARARGVLGVLVLVYAVNFIDRNILAVLLQPIKEELGVSDTAMGFLTGFAFAVFYTFAGIPIARLADRGSRRTVMAVGLAFWSLMTAASGLARSFAQLAVARVGVGIGEASATPAAHSLLSDYFPPERRTRAIAIYNTGASAGVLFGLLLGGWLQQAFGWRVAFAVVGLPGLAIALLVRVTVAEPARGGSEGLVDAGDAPSARETLRHLACLPSFRHLALAAGLYAMTAYGVISWAPTFMIRVHELGYAEVGTTLGLAIGIGGGAGTYAGGVLCDRLAARDVRWLVWIPAIAGAVLLPFFVVFALAEEASLALAAFVPVNLLNAVFAAPTYTITQGLARLRMRALASAVVLFVLNLVGLGLGPTLVGILNDLLEPRYGAAAVRYSLLIVVAVNAWAVIHSVLAGRTLRRDLARAIEPEV